MEITSNAPLKDPHDPVEVAPVLQRVSDPSDRIEELEDHLSDAMFALDSCNRRITALVEMVLRLEQHPVEAKQVPEGMMLAPIPQVIAEVGSADSGTEAEAQSDISTGS